MPTSRAEQIIAHAKEKFKTQLSGLSQTRLYKELCHIALQSETEAPHGTHKKRAVTALNNHLGPLSINQALILMNEIQFPRRGLSFICLERNCLFRIGSDYGRTDTYQHFVAKIQTHLIEKLEANHIDTDGNLKPEATAIIQAMLPAMIIPYDRSGDPADNAATRSFLYYYRKANPEIAVEDDETLRFALTLNDS